MEVPEKVPRRSQAHNRITIIIFCIPSREHRSASVGVGESDLRG